MLIEACMQEKGNCNIMKFDNYIICYIINHIIDLI